MNSLAIIQSLSNERQRLWRLAGKQKLTCDQRARLHDLPMLLDRAWCYHRVEIASNVRYEKRPAMDYTLDNMSADDMIGLMRETFRGLLPANFNAETWKRDYRRKNPHHSEYEVRRALSTYTVQFIPTDSEQGRRLERVVAHQIYRAEKRTRQRIHQREKHLSMGIQSG